MARVDWHIARKALLLCCLLTIAGAGDPPQPGKVLDEARQAGRSAASLPAPTEDYFHDMDGGADLKPDAATKLDPGLGRNTWLVWSGGNDRFWDRMTDDTFGAFDLLKIIAYDPNKPIDRADRWKYLGLINEPCFEEPTAPDPDRFGLLLDKRHADCPARSVRGCGEVSRREDRRARQHGAGRLALRRCQRHRRPAPVPQSRLRRGGEGEVGCGRATTRATRSWCGRIASACPAASAMSGQARSIRRPIRPIRSSPISAPPSARSTCGSTGCSSIDANPDNFFFQLVHTYRPGAMDTSLVSTDNINNPRTMNAIYSLGRGSSRRCAGDARRWPAASSTTSSSTTT